MARSGDSKFGENPLFVEWM